MSVSSRREARLLTADEADLVAQSHHPALHSLDRASLTRLIARLRERRDRARDLSQRQRREFRGKAAPSGTRPAGDNTGTREKAALLAAAVKRANKEDVRRESAEARNSLISNAHRALVEKAGSRECSRWPSILADIPFRHETGAKPKPCPVRRS